MFKLYAPAVSIVLMFCVFAGAQDAPKSRTDSITVSGGISKEQLALESQLNAIMSRAKLAQQAGRIDDALKEYGAALDMVRKQPLLTEQKEVILFTVGDAYCEAGRPAEAVPVLQELLEMKGNCASPGTDLYSCAEDQESLGIAKMGSGDVAGGLLELQAAKVTFGKAGELYNPHEYSPVIDLKQAQADLWIGVALFRLGKTTDAVNVIQGAIPHFTRVKGDDKVTVALRNSAADSLSQAQTLLSHFKTAAP